MRETFGGPAAARGSAGRSAAFGLRPRRAPPPGRGIFAGAGVAQVGLLRAAPRVAEGDAHRGAFPSPISVPQLSHTSTVFRANFLLVERGSEATLADESDARIHAAARTAEFATSEAG